jgi:hypothetical protein
MKQLASSPQGQATIEAGGGIGFKGCLCFNLSFSFELTHCLTTFMLAPNTLRGFRYVDLDGIPINDFQRADLLLRSTLTITPGYIDLPILGCHVRDDFKKAASYQRNFTST